MFIKDFILEPKGDDHLLRSIAKFFKNKGYPLFNWKELCNDLFASEDNLTTLKPSNYANKNNEKGLNSITKDVLVEISPKYYRPTEVELLLGDSKKAKKKIEVP